MLMNPSSLGAPKFITPSVCTSPAHCTRAPHLAGVSGLGAASRGSQVPEQSARPGVSSPKYPPWWHDRCKEPGLPGTAGRCWGDSSCAMGDAELVSGPRSPRWPDLKMLTILPIDKGNAGIFLCILDVGLYLRIRSQFANEF